MKKYKIVGPKFSKRNVSFKRKKSLSNWYDTHDAFGKPRGYRLSDIIKFR